MIKRFKHNVIGSIGLFGSLCSCGLDIARFYLRGITHDYPLNYLSGKAAELFTQPPTLISAGSEYIELAFLFYVVAYAVLSIVFASLYWFRTTQGMRRSTAIGVILIALQIGIGLLCSYALLYLVAAEIAFIMPLRDALKWLAFQVLLLFVVNLLVLIVGGNTPVDDQMRSILIELLETAAWQVIAFAVGYVAVIERNARMGLAAANAELRATQLLLADTVRGSERMRIARDLHDIVGHQLTALNLHLDLATRQFSEQVPAALNTSRELAQGLLSEVRVIVGAERSHQGINLREALEALCSGIPAPRIQLKFDANLEIASAAIAHTLFCCIQEAISNTLRHAGASQMTIEVRREDNCVLVQMEDNGGGNTQKKPEGNGLHGMRERLEQFGGKLNLDSQLQPGFNLQILLPFTGGAT